MAQKPEDRPNLDLILSHPVALSSPSLPSQIISNTNVIPVGDSIVLKLAKKNQGSSELLDKTTKN